MSSPPLLMPEGLCASCPLHTFPQLHTQAQTRLLSHCTLATPPRHTRHTHCTFVFAGGMWGVLSIPNPPKTWRGVSYTHSAGGYKKPPHLQHRTLGGGEGGAAGPAGSETVVGMEWPETGSCRRLGWGRARGDRSGAQAQGCLGAPPHLWAAVRTVMRANTGLHACAWTCDCTCLCSRSLPVQLVCPVKNLVLRLYAPWSHGGAGA